MASWPCGLHCSRSAEIIITTGCDFGQQIGFRIFRLSMFRTDIEQNALPHPVQTGLACH